MVKELSLQVAVVPQLLASVDLMNSARCLKWLQSFVPSSRAPVCKKGWQQPLIPLLWPARDDEPHAICCVWDEGLIDRTLAAQGQAATSLRRSILGPFSSKSAGESSGACRRFSAWSLQDAWPFARQKSATKKGSIQRGTDRAWWQLPDDIQELLPVPDDYFDRLSETTRSLGLDFTSKELLLRVLVHPTYYLAYLSPKLSESEWERRYQELMLEAASRGEKPENLLWQTRHTRVLNKLEYIGDAVLGLAANNALISKYPHLSVGDYTRLKGQLVCNRTLALAGNRELGLGQFLLTAPPAPPRSGQKDTWGPATEENIVSNAVEAFLGAITVEKDIVTAHDFALNVLFPMLERVAGEPEENHLDTVQKLASQLKMKLDYRVDTLGDILTPNFRARLYLDGREASRAEARTMKEAKRLAAKGAVPELRERAQDSGGT